MCPLYKDTLENILQSFTPATYVLLPNCAPKVRQFSEKQAGFTFFNITFFMQSVETIKRPF